MDGVQENLDGPILPKARRQKGMRSKLPVRSPYFRQDQVYRNLNFGLAYWVVSGTQQRHDRGIDSHPGFANRKQEGWMH